MKRMVGWDDEENGESEIEPYEEASETEISDDEQSDDEERRIKDVKSIERKASRSGNSGGFTVLAQIMEYLKSHGIV